MNNLQVLQEVKNVLNKSVCPKCTQSLKEAVVSGESDMYGNGIRYIGCTNCGHTSIYNDNYKSVFPIIAKSSTTMELLTQDINKAFAKGCVSLSSLGLPKEETPKKVEEDKVAEVFKAILKHLPEGSPSPVVFGNLGSQKEEIDNVLEQIKKAAESIPGAKVTVVDRTKDKYPEVELEPLMACRTFESTGKKEEAEPTNSYLVIDEYGDEFVYKNVTEQELVDAMDEDHNLEDEDLELYRLVPVNYTIKKQINID